MTVQHHSYYVSCDKFTVLVTIDEETTIRQTPPIVSKFNGQPFVNLIRWMKQNCKDVKIQELGMGCLDCEG